MDVALQYIVDKFEHALLAMGEKANVKSVEAKSSKQNHKGGQLNCSYCAGDNRAVDCTNYKTVMQGKITSLLNIYASVV